jgi:CTP:molybdopterin cytidylyltransferase MocA
VIAGLVLAAGSGSRLGRPKAEVLLGGVRLLDRAVGTLRAGGCDKVLAVVRPDTAPADGVQLVVNPDPDDGMSSSLRAGLAALPDDADAVVVTLVDLPDIRPSDVRALLGWYRQGASIIVTRRARERSHPVLIARRWLAEFGAAATGDQGARAFFNAHLDQVDFVDLAQPITDIDTPEDLARAEQALGGN